MPDDVVIRAEELGKKYLIGHQAERERYVAFRDVLTRTARGAWRKATDMARGRAIVAGDTVEEFWALRDVSFEIKRGEILGIIGRNGAGKSTLLKILSRITEPSRGRVTIKGRVASLLEVGTGFHPELTGRENIYLNGAILGMSRAEILRRFDEIVAFAEVENFLDTPVKRYSSGMYVRLAFAIAAHIEPDILIVDEVLAVGDAQFQKKCLGKMAEVGRQDRTVLFVSHNIAAINRLCSHAMFLQNGGIMLQGEAEPVVSRYLQSGSGDYGEISWDSPGAAPGNGKIRLRAVRVTCGGKVTRDVPIDEEVCLAVDFWILVGGTRNLCVNIYVLDGTGTVVFSTANAPAANQLRDDWFGQAHAAGLYRATCTLPENFLNDRLYFISVYIVTLGPLAIEVRAEHLLSINGIDSAELREPGGGSDWQGLVRVRLPWATHALPE